MNYDKKQILSFLCVTSLFLHNSQSRADGWQDFGKALAVVGTAALTAGAVIWGCSEESSANLLDRAERVYRSNATRMSLINKIDSYNHISYRDLAEHELEEVALCIAKDNSIEREIDESIDSLSHVYRKLSERIVTIQNSCDRLDRMFLYNMQTVAEKISYWMYDLKQTKEMLDYYRDYFKLFEYERTMHERYEREFQAIAEYESNWKYRELIQCIASRQKQHERYPYSSYLDMVHNDQKAITRLLNNLSNSYPQRRKSAVWVIQTLSRIETIISTSYEFKEEKETKRLEEECERQRIIAQQQRNHELALKAERKHLKRERKKMERMVHEYDVNHSDCVNKTSINIRWQS